MASGSTAAKQQPSHLPLHLVPRHYMGHRQGSQLAGSYQLRAHAVCLAPGRAPLLPPPPVLVGAPQQRASSSLVTETEFKCSQVRLAASWSVGELGRVDGIHALLPLPIVQRQQVVGLRQANQREGRGPGWALCINEQCRQRG